jgi:C4-dicarboxylate-specific signal transduction histidine kinase
MFKTLAIAAVAAISLSSAAMADRYCGPNYAYYHYSCHWVGGGPGPGYVVGSAIGTAGYVAGSAVNTAGYVAGSAVNAATGIATGVIGVVTGQ